MTNKIKINSALNKVLNDINSVYESIDDTEWLDSVYKYLCEILSMQDIEDLLIKHVYDKLINTVGNIGIYMVSYY